MYKRLLLISLGVLAVALICSQWLFPFASSAGQAPSEAQQKREQLYRLNNQGIAFMEQYKHEDAVKKFKEALATDANFALARINLALALFYLNDSRAAVEEARAAVKLVPNSPTAHYVLGASLRNEKLYDEALAEFNQVLKLDPQDPATNILIGQIYSQKQQYNDAIVAFRRALDAESFNATAAYSLAQAQIRAGQAAEGQVIVEENRDQQDEQPNQPDRAQADGQRSGDRTARHRLSSRSTYSQPRGSCAGVRRSPFPRACA